MSFSISGHHAVRLTAAIASLGAGVVHFAVVPNHLATWWASGLFFILLAVFQVLWAPTVSISRSRALLGLGGVVNAASALLWAGTRVWGQPVGPQAGVPLPVGPAGVIATVLEVTLVVSVLVALRIRFGRQLRGAVAASVLGAASVAAVALTIPAVSAALEHDHSAHADKNRHDHGREESGEHQHDDTDRKPADHHKQQTPPPPTDSEPSPTLSDDRHGHGHDEHAH